jgi:hypothetical protein
MTYEKICPCLEKRILQTELVGTVEGMHWKLKFIHIEISSLSLH